MKVKHLFLAFYLIAVVFYPCDDVSACAKVDVSTYTVSADAHQHPESKDLCSPLCICSCCAASIQLTTGFVNIPEVASHNTRFLTPYSISRVVSNAQSIWQPPKIA